MNNEEDSSKESSSFLLIEDVKSVRGENSAAFEESNIATSPDLTRVKEEILTTVTDTEKSEDPTLIIKDTPTSISNNIQGNTKVLVTRDNPRVVLQDIVIQRHCHEPKLEAGNVICSNRKIAPKQASSAHNFEPSLDLQSSDSVPSVITNDTLSYGMVNMSSSGAGNIISGASNIAISVGMKPNVPGPINTTKPINNRLLVGLASKPVIVNGSPFITVTRVSSSSSSDVTKDNTPTAFENKNSASKQNTDQKRSNVSVPAIRSEKNIWDVIDKRRAAIKQNKKFTAQVSSSKTPDINVNPRMETEERCPKQTAWEEMHEILHEEESTNEKHISEDTLGGLALTLQSSILERLDTLNRNIETNTCALTILSKTIKDSSDNQMLVINNLSKVLTTVGNALLASVDRLMSPTDEG